MGAIETAGHLTQAVEHLESASAAITWGDYHPTLSVLSGLKELLENAAELAATGELTDDGPAGHCRRAQEDLGDAAGWLAAAADGEDAPGIGQCQDMTTSAQDDIGVALSQMVEAESLREEVAGLISAALEKTDTLLGLTGRALNIEVEEARGLVIQAAGEAEEIRDRISSAVA